MRAMGHQACTGLTRNSERVVGEHTGNGERNSETKGGR